AGPSRAAGAPRAATRPWTRAPGAAPRPAPRHSRCPAVGGATDGPLRRLRRRQTHAWTRPGVGLAVPAGHNAAAPGRGYARAPSPLVVSLITLPPRRAPRGCQTRGGAASLAVARRATCRARAWIRAPSSWLARP